MKNILLILAISFLFAGCRSTKKLTESSSVISNQTETVQKTDVKEETKVNNDKSTYKKTTITETEYQPGFKTTPETKTNEVTVPAVSPDNFVKVIKVTVIEEGTKDNSKIETKKLDNSEVATKTEDKSKVESSAVEKKSVPFPWGWMIWVCVALGISVFIYFSKSKPATIVKTFIELLFK